MKKYKIKSGFITQKIGDKTTIFQGETSVLFTLNETSSYIFQGLKLGWQKEKIIKDLIEKYGADKKQAEEDFEQFIEELEKKKIISAE